eukprot:scaffold98556_cov24-Tisochrysis_lutea.AAC.1
MVPAQHGHWRAAEQAILALDIVSPHGLIIAGCRDHNVTLWTLDGAIVGILGERACTNEQYTRIMCVNGTHTIHMSACIHTHVHNTGDDMWDIHDLRTWRDPHGETKEEPMEEQDSLYLQ